MRESSLTPVEKAARKARNKRAHKARVITMRTAAGLPAKVPHSSTAHRACRNGLRLQRRP